MPSEADQRYLSSNHHEAAAEEAAADGPSHPSLHFNQDSDPDEPELFLLQPARRRTSCSSASSVSSSHSSEFSSQGYTETARFVPPAARHVNGTANSSRNVSRQRQTQSGAAASVTASVLQWQPKQGPAQRQGKQAANLQQEPQPQEFSRTPQPEGAATSCRLCGEPEGACSRPVCRGYCIHCDRPGHTTPDCRKRARLLQKQQQQQQQQQRQQDSQLTDCCQRCRQPMSVCMQSACRGWCTHCDRPGHRTADCRRLARTRGQQQVQDQQEQQQAVELCQLCGQPVSSCRRPACWGYCTHCNKEGHRTANCRRRAAATASTAAVQQPQPLAVVSGSSSNSRPGSQPPAAAAASIPALKADLLLHKATAMHAVQQIISNVTLQQQIQSAVQSAPRQQVVAAVCEQLHHVSADVEANVDNLSSQDLEELVTLAELVTAAQQLQQQQGGKKKKQAVANGRAVAPAAATAAKHGAQFSTAAGELGAAEAAAAAAAASSSSGKIVRKPRIATSAAGQLPVILLQRPQQTSISAPTAAAEPAAHQELPPPPPPRKPKAAAPAAVIAPSALLSANGAPPAVIQHQQQLVGLQRPHPVYAGAASNTLPAAVPPAGTQKNPNTPAAAAPGPYPAQLPATVPVTLSGPLQAWMLCCKAGATRAVQEWIQQDHIVQQHLINIVDNTAEWQLVTVLNTEVGFLIKMVGAGQLHLQDVEGLRRLGQYLGQAKQMGPHSHITDGALTPVGCHSGAGTAAAAVQRGGPSGRSAATTAAAGTMHSGVAPSYPDVCYKALLAWLEQSNVAT